MKYNVMFFILFFSIMISCKEKEELFNIPDYKKWKRAVDGVLTTPIPGHGETYRIIYANDMAYQSKVVRDSSGQRVQMNEGSVVVKEVYDKQSDVGYKIPGLFIMIKESSDPDAINGWVYYMKKPGKDPVEVKWRMCVGCHEAANEKHPYFDGNKENMFRDYLFVKIAK